ncbi:transcriptional regulator, TetR family [Desulfacinum infernum DSM 9756]|uniref:Transcriptional regulator, TetR family n=1 Tax=Desulfacinum infernum DSM 9756 TaxID=1121391 RepID=A0A1M4TBS4_9BACT|nr:TetR/AcrR family transcriptional regulator [Desulfacinum infernum]SHE41855.1 transcriptional regulator, TetR family [Desulfacinum infernum DSM 9756]
MSESKDRLDSKTRRDEIAEAALRLVNRDGLKKLSLSRLAAEVGVVPSALYRHYPNKDAILDAVLELIRDRLTEHVERVRKEHFSALSRLDALLARHVQMITSQQAIPRILFSEEIVGDAEERRGRLAEVIHEHVMRLASLVAEGQAGGEIRPDVSPESAAVMFLGIVQPAAILWHASGGRFDLTEHARTAWNLYRECLTAKS